MIYIKINENKEILQYTENLEEAEAFGYNGTVETTDEFELSYDWMGTYLKGYAPEPPYDWKRRQEYPQLGEQLDMIWHLMDEGILGEEVKSSDFYLKLKAVKDKYPKEQITDTETTDIESTEPELVDTELTDTLTDETQEM